MMPKSAVINHRLNEIEPTTAAGELCLQKTKSLPAVKCCAGFGVCGSPRTGRKPLAEQLRVVPDAGRAEHRADILKVAPDHRVAAVDGMPAELAVRVPALVGRRPPPVHWLERQAEKPRVLAELLQYISWGLRHSDTLRRLTIRQN